MTEEQSTLAIIVFVSLLVFLIIRELVTWYFKINERVKLQKEQNALLEQLVTLMQPAEKEFKFSMKKDKKTEPMIAD